MARSGLGEAGALQLTVTRMMRTESEDPTARIRPQVQSLQDVTHGLGIDQADSQRLQRMVEENSARFSQKTQTQKLMLARGSLLTTMRASMKHIDSDTRGEVLRRATEFWRRTQQTDYGKTPTVRWGVEKSMDATLMIPTETLMKSGARGGKYYRRVPKPGGGYRYFYTKDAYDKAHGAEAHANGPETAAARASAQSDADTFMSMAMAAQAFRSQTDSRAMRNMGEDDYQAAKRHAQRNAHQHRVQAAMRVIHGAYAATREREPAPPKDSAAEKRRAVLSVQGLDKRTRELMRAVRSGDIHHPHEQVEALRRDAESNASAIIAGGDIEVAKAYVRELGEQVKRMKFGRSYIEDSFELGVADAAISQWQETGAKIMRHFQAQKPAAPAPAVKVAPRPEPTPTASGKPEQLSLFGPRPVVPKEPAKAPASGAPVAAAPGDEFSIRQEAYRVQSVSGNTARLISKTGRRANLDTSTGQVQFSSKEAPQTVEVRRLPSSVAAPEKTEADPKKYNAGLASALKALKKMNPNIASISGGYKGTGAKAHRRQIVVRFKDGQRPFDFFMEAGSVGMGGAYTGPATENVSTSGRSYDDVVKDIHRVILARRPLQKALVSEVYALHVFPRLVARRA